MAVINGNNVDNIFFRTSAADTVLGLGGGIDLAHLDREWDHGRER